MGVSLPGADVLPRAVHIYRAGRAGPGVLNPRPGLKVLRNNQSLASRASGALSGSAGALPLPWAIPAPQGAFTLSGDAGSRALAEACAAGSAAQAGSTNASTGAAAVLGALSALFRREHVLNSGLRSGASLSDLRADLVGLSRLLVDQRNVRVRLRLKLRDLSHAGLQIGPKLRRVIHAGVANARDLVHLGLRKAERRLAGERGAGGRSLLLLSRAPLRQRAGAEGER